MTKNNTEKFKILCLGWEIINTNKQYSISWSCFFQKISHMFQGQIKTKGITKIYLLFKQMEKLSTKHDLNLIHRSSYISSFFLTRKWGNMSMVLYFFFKASPNLSRKMYPSDVYIQYTTRTIYYSRKFLIRINQIHISAHWLRLSTCRELLRNIYETSKTEKDWEEKSNSFFFLSHILVSIFLIWIHLLSLEIPYSLELTKK